VVRYDRSTVGSVCAPDASTGYPVDFQLIVTMTDEAGRGSVPPQVLLIWKFD
jgi:hypothetical protein